MEAGSLDPPALAHRLGRVAQAEADGSLAMPEICEKDILRATFLPSPPQRFKSFLELTDHEMAQGNPERLCHVGSLSSKLSADQKELIWARGGRKPTTQQCCREQGVQQAEAHVYDASEGVQRVLWVGDMNVLIAIHRQQLSAFLQIQYAPCHPTQKVGGEAKWLNMPLGVCHGVRQLWSTTSASQQTILKNDQHMEHHTQTGAPAWALSGKDRLGKLLWMQGPAPVISCVIQYTCFIII